MNTYPRRICVGAIAAFLTATFTPAHAQNTWNGTADALWDTNGNWSTALKPLATDDVIFPTPIPGSGATITLGAGEVANSLLFQNAYTLQGGTLALTGGTITVDPAVTATVASALGGTILTKAGSGTLVLSGLNTHTGLTTVSAGILNIQNAGALGTTAGGTTVTPGASLELQGGVIIGAEALTLNGAGFNAPGALRNVSGNNTWGGNVTLASATSIISDAGLLTIDAAAGSAITGAFNLTVGGEGDITVVDIIATGAGVITKEGAGTLRILADPSTTGGMTINGGVVELNHSGTVDFVTTINNGGTLRTLQADLGDDDDVIINAGGTLDFQSVADSMGGLSGAGTVTRQAATSAILTVNNGGETTTFDGIIENGAGTVGLTKAGTGTLTLTNASTFAGTLLINNSVLVLAGPNAALATPTINVGDNNGGGETLIVGGVADVVATPLDRLSDALTVTLNGSGVGGMTYAGPAIGSAGNIENINVLAISNGRNNLTLLAGTGNEAQLNANSITRTNDATLLLRGDNLGGVGVGSARLVFGSLPTLSGAGGDDGTATKSIVAFAIGGNTATNPGTDFLTYDFLLGMRPLAASEYDSTITGTTPLRNVKIGALGDTVNANQAINSLIVGGAATVSGTVTINAGAKVLVNSGAVLLTGDGTLTSPSIVGAGGLDFGANNGIIHTAQNGTAMTASINVRIGGSAGLTIGRAGDATNITSLGGDNTVIGTLLNNQGTLRLASSGAANDNHPMTYLGRANTALQIFGNNVVLRDLQSSGGTSTFQNGSTTNAILTAYLTAPRTVNTVISNGSTGTLGLVSAGGQVLTLNQTNTYTGPTEVRSGVITLVGNNTGTIASSASIVVSGAGTLRLTNTSGNVSGNRVGSVPLVLAAGTLDFDNNASAASFSETVGAVTLRPGTNFVWVDRAAAGQTSVLTVTSLNRDPGGLLIGRSQTNGTEVFDLGQTTQSRLVFTPGFTADDGIIGPWAVVQTAANAREFAKYVASGTISYTPLVTGDYTAALASGANPTQNVRIATTPLALTSSTQINSLTLNQTADTVIDIGAGNTLRVESGGVAVNNNFNGSFINGTLTAGNGANAPGELTIHTVSAVANPVVIDSVIADNGLGVVTLVKGGGGVLDLQGVANTYTGKTYLSGGTMRINADANLGAAPAAPSVGHFTTATNAIVEVTESFTLNANRGLALGGGTTVFSMTAGTGAGTGKTLTYNGAITTVADVNEAGLTFQSNATTTLTGPGSVSATLTAPLNIGGALRIEAGTITTGAGTNVIGRSLQVGVNGVGSFIQNNGTLRVGAGINDTLDIGVTAADSVNKTGTLNLNGVSNFTANVDLVRIGVVTGGTGNSGNANVTFATNNEITAGTSILIGDSGGAGLGTQSVAFGTGVHSITTRTLTWGGRKGVTNLTLGAGGQINLQGFGQRTLNMFVGRNNVGTASLQTSTFNTAPGSVIASFNSLIIGEKSSNNTGGADASFSIGTSAASNLEANSVTLGSIASSDGVTVAASRGFGTLNMGGGSFTVFNDVTMGNFAGTAGTARGTLNLTGGTFTIGGSITQSVAVPERGAAMITVNGATAVLDLRNDAAGDTSLGTIAASQIAFRSGAIIDTESATLTGHGATDGVTFGNLADALIVRDVNIGFAVNLTNATVNQGGIHYEAAGGGAGATLAGAVDLGFVGRTFNVENSAAAPGDLRVNGAVTGSVPLAKVGAGALWLNGAVAADVQVSAGALGGTGTITGLVDVASGAALGPGAGLGTLGIVGHLAMNGTSTFALEINTTAGTTDVAAVTGSLTLAAANTVQLSITDLAPMTLGSGVFPFLTYATGSWNGGLFAIGGNVIDDDVEIFTVGGNSFRLDYNQGGNTVALIAVPEPGAAMSLLGGLGGLAALRRPRRRA